MRLSTAKCRLNAAVCSNINLLTCNPFGCCNPTQHLNKGDSAIKLGVSVSPSLDFIEKPDRQPWKLNWLGSAACFAAHWAFANTTWVPWTSLPRADKSRQRNLKGWKFERSPWKQGAQKCDKSSCYCYVACRDLLLQLCVASVCSWAPGFSQNIRSDVTMMSSTLSYINYAAIGSRCLHQSHSPFRPMGNAGHCAVFASKMHWEDMMPILKHMSLTQCRTFQYVL